MFIIGGETASVEEYLASEQHWVFVPHMPGEVSSAAAVALDGKLLVIGGSNAGDTDEGFSPVLEYNLVDRSWKELPSLLTARSSCAATVLGGDVVVLGGQVGKHVSDSYIGSVERYNRQSQCWEAMASLPTPFLRLAAASVRI